MAKVATTPEVFQLLIKGKIISTNSSRYSREVRYLLDPKKRANLTQLLAELGYQLVAENGYFFLSKPMTREEEGRFLKKFRRTFLEVALLKRAFPGAEGGAEVSQMEFIRFGEGRVDWGELQELTGAPSQLEGVARLFNDLEQEGVLERIGEDRYQVLNGIYYYLQIVQLGGNDE